MQPVQLDNAFEFLTQLNVLLVYRVLSSVSRRYVNSTICGCPTECSGKLRSLRKIIFSDRCMASHCVCVCLCECRHRALWFVECFGEWDQELVSNYIRRSAWQRAEDNQTEKNWTVVDVILTKISGGCQRKTKTKLSAAWKKIRNAFTFHQYHLKYDCSSNMLVTCIKIWW